MDRYNRGAGIASPPSAPATPANPYYTEGNPGLGIPATQPGPWFFHMLTEELRAVIVAAGITPDHTDLTQLTQAIAVLVSNAQRSVILDSVVFEASVSNGEVVYWDAANNRFDEAIADGTAKQNAVGFADVINSKVYAFGSCPIFSGLTPGAYYLSDVTPGAITASPPASNIVKLGIAKSATEIFVDIDQSNQQQQSAVQGARSNLKGSSTGISALVTYTADELVLGNGAGQYVSAQNWNGTINMTVIGAGGLDVGAVAANTWYYAYAIIQDNGTKSFVASLSPTTPTLPVGYTKWARIGSFRTDATANKYPLSFIQAGNKTQYKVAVGSNVASLPAIAIGVSGTPTALSAVSITAVVPLTAAEIVLQLLGGNANNSAAAPNAAYVGGLTGTNSPPLNSTGSTGTQHNTQGIFVIESTNVYYYGANTGAGLLCRGYVDNL